MCIVIKGGGNQRVHVSCITLGESLAVGAILAILPLVGRPTSG
ncbi:hypothetical protein CA13_33130 [Planctomycetes bacterium CA13]|uniref:Uncharacterized protein n=1 Tax=Novipirellula herctigrandis TaxID=2527986 RepID=A0A5C5Z396_9BACT|nr:hypothetical protein CA13_33130 [Planctomycetes bacterium CA13]